MIINKVYFRNSFKLYGYYCMAIILFGVFLPILQGVFSDTLGEVLPFFSFLVTVILVLLLYPFMKSTAVIEQRPYQGLQPFRFRGFLYGLIGYAPVIVIELLYPIANFDEATYMQFKPIVLKALMCPVSWVIDLFGGSVLGYVLASVIVPVTAGLGYLAGYYNIDLGKLAKGSQK